MDREEIIALIKEALDSHQATAKEQLDAIQTQINGVAAKARPDKKISEQISELVSWKQLIEKQIEEDDNTPEDTAPPKTEDASKKTGDKGEIPIEIQRQIELLKKEQQTLVAQNKQFQENMQRAEKEKEAAKQQQIKQERYTDALEILSAKGKLSVSDIKSRSALIKILEEGGHIVPSDDGTKFVVKAPNKFNATIMEEVPLEEALPSILDNHFAFLLQGRSGTGTGAEATTGTAHATPTVSVQEIQQKLNSGNYGKEKEEVLKLLDAL
ncbi:MAG: hypothetical protein ACRC78_03020 [Planktothrix sp.]